MNIEKLSRDPRAIKALTGLSYQEFSDLVPTFETSIYDIQMQKRNRKRKAGRGRGRRGVLQTTEPRLFFVLFYLKTYPTFDVLAFLFGIVVEHAIGGMKRYRAFADVLRNHLGHVSDQVALLSAGLWNYHLNYV